MSYLLLTGCVSRTDADAKLVNGCAAEREYKCIFAEEMGPFGLNYSATIYQLQMNGQTYGKDGDKILGSFNDHLKLTETVEQGLNRP